jgi:L-alanine-DL-glutamate epimerase-like enolase superfamily enzyme
MAIASVEVIPYSLPFKQPYETARGRLESREMVLLRLRGDDGSAGLGEAVPLSLRGGATLGEVEAELRRFGERICAGGGSQSARFAGELMRLSAPGRCAVLTAWLDLAARSHGVPAWRLLGAEQASPVRCNATLSQGEPLHVAQQALAWEADGFGSFKLKLGGPADAETVKMTRQALAPEARIRVDANGAWDVEHAAAVLAEIEEAEIELAEQPVATLEEMAELAGRSAIPLSADESVASPDDALRAVQLGACRYATVKLSKVGGHADARGVAARLPVYLSSALDGPVGIAAAAHLAQVINEDEDPGLAHGLATGRLFGATIAARECELERDMLHLPDGPGLGVVIDETALQRHRL